MTAKKQIRKQFREAVFKRDGFCCKMCGLKSLNPEIDLDAHHITDRNEMPNGGYVKENGISVCKNCHTKAELFHRTGGKQYELGFHPNDLYAKIGSSKEIAIKLSSLI